MALTIANVLVGVATLGVRQPNDAIAEWSKAPAQAGTYSVKLYKGGTGNAGSTCLEIIPPAGILGSGLTAAIAANKYEYYHHCSAVLGNFGQFELRFEDPDSVGWVEITGVPLQNYLGTAGWVQQTAAAADKVGFGGHKEDGSSFFDWDLGNDWSDVYAEINTTHLADTMANWVLKRVRIELWECSPLRTMYVDTVKINNVSYTIEPGGTAPGMSLNSPFTEVGYTEDGVVFEYNADTADIEVEEETLPIDRVITKETIAVTCNMAESSLANINNAMAGAVVAGTVLSLDDGVNKTMNLKIKGTNPDGYNREIFIPLATATGVVGMSYKKGEKTIVPVTFQALKGVTDACTIVDNVV